MKQWIFHAILAWSNVLGVEISERQANKKMENNLRNWNFLKKIFLFLQPGVDSWNIYLWK